jgi:hypothetical protein
MGSGVIHREGLYGLVFALLMQHARLVPSGRRKP